MGSIKGVIRRRKEKENKEAQTGKEIEMSVDAELDDIEGVEKESEEESEEPDDDCRSAMRTHLKPPFIRPRRKEMGRLYTGTAYKMRKKRRTVDNKKFSASFFECYRYRSRNLLVVSLSCL